MDTFDTFVDFWGHWRRVLDYRNDDPVFSETRCVICGHVLAEDPPSRDLMRAHDAKQHPETRWIQELVWFRMDLQMAAFRLCGHAALDAFEWPDKLSPGNPLDECRFWDDFTEEKAECLGPRMLDVVRARELERRHHSGLYNGRERLILFMEGSL